ncbi:MAG: class I SAM-dependent methyltransferase [Methylobacter sp.]
MFQKPTKACELPRLSGETDVELAERRNRRYYEEQVEVSIKWWNRVGVSVDLAGKRVLDIGCGHGALAVEAAQRGAIMVLCIDIDLESVNFANSNVRNNPVPGVGVSFSTIGFIHIEAGSFDVCLSKDTFEHVIYMPSLLSQIHRILAGGGILVAGFSPLYYSLGGSWRNSSQTAAVVACHFARVGN